MENIEIYFESIKQVYDQIIDWEKSRINRPESFIKKITDLLVIISVIIFILSLVPIIPSLFVFMGSRQSWVVLGFSLSQPTILTYASAWGISILATLPLLILNIWLDDKITIQPDKDKDKAPQTLSSEQIAFIVVYQAYKELKIFFVSHIDQNIKKAIMSLRGLHKNRFEIYSNQYLEPWHPRIDIQTIKRENYLVDYYSARSITNQPSLTHQIHVAQEFLKTFEKFPWFNIDVLTKARLQAFISFQKKILDRLEKREDLPAVLNVLENLSRFLYAFLPEHQANMSQDELTLLHAEGIKYLDTFVESTNKLIDYPPEQIKDGIKQTNKNLTFLQKIQLFYFRNVFFRFIVWLLLLLGITTALVYIASLKITKLDINIMVSTIVATSVAGAAALAVIGRKPQKAQQELEDKSMQQD